jgi:hypothetical protein
MAKKLEYIQSSNIGKSHCFGRRTLSSGNANGNDKIACGYGNSFVMSVLYAQSRFYKIISLCATNNPQYKSFKDTRKYGNNRFSQMVATRQ